MSNTLKFLFFILAFFSQKIFAENIKFITIDGLNTISRGTVLNYLPVEVGDDIKESDLPIIANELNKTDFFSKINLTLRTEALHINLEENPTIKFIDYKNYENNSVLNSDIIDDINKNFALQPGKIFVSKKLEKLLTQLITLYKRKGFYSAKISPVTKIDENNRIGIELLFEEGEKSLINDFRILGSKNFSEEDLLESFNIGKPDIFFINYFTEKDNFSYEELEAGIRKIETLYLNKGFLDFEISKKNILHNNVNNSIDIEINISEGRQYKISKIIFDTSLSAELEKKLRSFFDINDGDYLNRIKILSGTNKVSEFFQNKGYAFTRVESKVLNISKSGFVDIQILINDNVQTYIDRIEISGNNRTQDDVIRREFSLLEGQIYSKKQLDESIKKIKRLGFFSDVSYELKRNAKFPDKLKLVIEVVETKTGEISIGLSHSNSTGAAINAGISQNNILGTGNIFNASISNSDAVKEFSMYFKDPYFNNMNHSLSYGFFNKSLDASNLDAANYSIDESGFNLGYGIPMDSNSNFSTEAKFSSLDLTCGSDLKNIYEVNDCASSDDLDTKFSFTYSSNSLNDFYFPSEGVRNIITTSIAVPLGDFKYYQLEASHRSYYPVLDDKTFKISSRLNFASGYGGKELPFFKRYFEGGSSSIRGFDFNSLGSKYSNDKPKGGEISFVSSLGISSNLNALGIENPNMRGIFFADAGSISDNLNNFDINDLRASVGVQFSWVTPIGPLGFNFANPVLKKEGDSTKSFSFELGSKF